MKSKLTPRFRKDFARLPQQIQMQAKKKFELFKDQSRLKSLRIKKMKGFDDVWEGHITKGYVFTFHWENDAESGEQTAVFRRIGSHDIYDDP